jgi:acyl transferase domain-containing protein
MEFPEATEPAVFHDRVMGGVRAFRHESLGTDEDALAERTAARALSDAGAHADELRVGRLVARNPSCSLRAIAAACDALTAAEYDLVLAGGVSLGTDPEWLEFYRRNQTPPPDEVRPYDARPSGSLPGEGCGILALMPLASARDAKLEVYAEIVAWSAADPGDDDPGDRIRHAYLRAGVTPAMVQYLEGHGAATNAGDQAELELLLDVYSSAQRPRNCALGAVSGCLGDVRAAGGAASLIKSVLAMASGTIPPTAGNQQPHHLLEKETTPFWLPRSAVPWPDEGPRLAAVNAMTSGPVHVVLRRIPEPPRSPGRRRRPAHAVPPTEPPAPQQQPAPPQPPVSQQPVSQPTSAADLVPRPRTPGEPRLFPSPRSPLDHATRLPGPEPADQVNQPEIPVSQPAAPPVPPVVPKPPVLVALYGSDRSDLASALDTIAIMATRLSSTDLHEFARQLAADLAAAKCGPGPLRAAILAEDPPQLAERARQASAATRQITAAGVHHGSGFFLSEDAAGRVAVLLAGLPDTPLEHTRFFAECVATFDWLSREEVTPAVVAGYGAGEIMALAWAGSLTMADAAHLMGRRAEIVAAAPRHPGTGTRRNAENLGPAMRGAVTAVRLGPPLRRVLSAAAGRELAAGDDLVTLLADGLAAPGRLGAAVPATDLVVVPAGHPATGPCVPAPDQRVPATVTTAKAALFAAGATTRVS